MGLEGRLCGSSSDLVHRSTLKQFPYPLLSVFFSFIDIYFYDK